MFPKTVLSRGLFVLSMVAVLTTAVGAVHAECRLDWNNNGYIDQDDYLVGDPMGGYYAEWYINQYYASYYPILFPGADSSRLDYNGDTLIDEADLMGELNPALPTEGYYVEWYIFMFYPGYYPIFMPEFDCENPPPVDTDGDGVPDHLDPCPNDYPDDLDNDGACGVAPKGTAESCASPYVLNHYTIHTQYDINEVGSNGYYDIDFADNWLDDHDFTATAGCGDPAPPDTDTVYAWGSEFVLLANVKAGQTLDVKASQSTQLTVRILDTCDEVAGTCIDSWVGDDFGADPTRFAPSVDSGYYIVIEGDANAYAYQQGYSFSAVVYDASETYCGDGLDNDMDGFIDCVDPDCYSGCAVSTLVHESFDATAGWNVTTFGPWNWSDTSNPTGSEGGYLNISSETDPDETYWIELDLSGVDVTAYSNIYMTMYHSHPTGSSFREPKIQVSYDDGVVWTDALIEYDFVVDWNAAGLEVFNLSPQLEGRPGARLRVASAKDCASSYSPEQCATAEGTIEWNVDEIKVIAWGSPSSGSVVGQVDTSVDFFTGANLPVNIDPPVVQGSGETCEDSIVLTRTVLDVETGDDFINRDIVAQCGNGPNTEGYNADHDYDAIESCMVYAHYDLEKENQYPVVGSDKIYTAHLEAGERLWALNTTGMDARYFVLEGGCDPVLSTPVCAEQSDAEFHGYYEFEAPVAGDYHLVVKTEPFDPCDQPWNSNRTVSFNLEVGQYTPYEVNCTNGIDDDGDSQIDCLDPNCFEMCNRDLLFAEYFTDGIPDNFEIVGTPTDGWMWCNATPGGCTSLVSATGPDYNRFADSGGGYAILLDNDYGGAPAMATPTIDVSGHGGSNLGLSFAARYIARSPNFTLQSKLFVDVIVDGVVVLGRGEPIEVYYERWVRGTQFIDLSQWAATAQTIKLRFSVQVPSGLKTGPWRLDDIMLTSW